jgi:cell division control protein 45
LALTKLGLFVQEIYEQMKKKPKPLVLGALNEQKDTFLVVGLSLSPTSNHFSLIFETAAQNTGARITLHTFDGAIVEICRADASLFIEHLQYGLSV